MIKITKIARGILFLAASLLIAVGGAAQSRMPEVKIQPRVDPKAGKDSLELEIEERPYFLLIDQSEKALQDGDYEAAALRLVEAMSVEPENELNVALLSNLGMIYYYNEQDSLALVVLERAIERSPKLIAPREGRARVLVAQGRDKDAYAEYANIIDIDSLNTNARYMHGMMALYSSNLQGATKDLEVLKSVIPTSPRTMLLEATMFSLTGCEREAVSLFRKLIEKDPAPEYYSQMVACLLVLDELGQVSETIGEWLEKYPNDPELFYYRAILNKKRYLPEDAHKDAKKAIQLGADPDRVASIFI